MSDRGRSGEPLRNLGVRLGFSESAMRASSVIIGCALDPQPGPPELAASMRGAPAPTEGSPEQHVDARRMQRWAALPASPVQGHAALRAARQPRRCIQLPGAAGHRQEPSLNSQNFLRSCTSRSRRAARELVPDTHSLRRQGRRKSPKVPFFEICRAARGLHFYIR